MAQLDTVKDEHGHEHIVARLEFGIGVDIDDVDVRAELGRKRRELSVHVVAKVAPGPPVKHQPWAALATRHFWGAAARGRIGTNCVLSPRRTSTATVFCGSRCATA